MLFPLPPVSLTLHWDCSFSKSISSWISDESIADLSAFKPEPVPVRPQRAGGRPAGMLGLRRARV